MQDERENDEPIAGREIAGSENAEFVKVEMDPV